MRFKDFYKLYFALLILHLAVIYRPDSTALYYISKPALLFSLLSFFINRSEGIEQGLRRALTIGLGFSLVGDIVLMYKGELWFLLGMAAFALAHIAYITFYLRQKLALNLTRVLLSSLLPVLGVLALYFLVETPPDLAPFLYAYALLIGLHFVVSLGFIKVGNKHSRLPAVGAALFIISDLLLAYRLFNLDVVWLNLGVMITYGLAQFLIVIGVLKVLEGRSSESDQKSLIP